MEKELNLQPTVSEYGKVMAGIRELIPEHNAKKILVVCEEWFQNILSHSGATKIRVHMKRDGDELTVVFTDDGKQFDPTTYQSDREFEDFDLGGMGLSMMKEITVVMEYQRVEEKNQLRLVFRV